MLTTVGDPDPEAQYVEGHERGAADLIWATQALLQPACTGQTPMVCRYWTKYISLTVIVAGNQPKASDNLDEVVEAADFYGSGYVRPAVVDQPDSAAQCGATGRELQTRYGQLKNSSACRYKNN